MSSSINFFATECREDALNETLFGLCDDENGEKAYTDTQDKSRWIATVKNDAAKDVVFTAIDKCVMKDDEYEGKGRCDGMLTTDEHLFFVELKNQRKSWITNAVEQLESTVQFFIKNHAVEEFKHKKAFACNKKHRSFEVIDQETNLRFFRTYSFRLDIQAEIIVV